MIQIVPISKTDARRFIAEHHRHNEAPHSMNVQLVAALEDSGEVVAVVTAGRPVARMLADGFTLEVSRVCVRPGYDPTRNANSRLYGAIRRAATALGYRRLVTYTLQSESGTSLRASGFGVPIDIGSRSWEGQGRERTDQTLWGERINAANQAKYRWEIEL